MAEYIDPRSGKTHEVVSENDVDKVLQVPIFSLGEAHGIEYDQEWFDEALRLFEEDQEENWFPAIIIGHTKELDEEKPRVGQLENLALVGKNIVADMAFFVKDAFESFLDGAWPGRSIEVLDKIYAVALLSVTPPFFKTFKKRLHALQIYEEPSAAAHWILTDPVPEVSILQEVQTLVERMQRIKDQQELNEREDELHDLHWLAMDILWRIRYDDDLTSQEKQEQATTVRNEWMELIKDISDSYISKFNERSLDMGESKDGLLTVDHVNQLADAEVQKRMAEADQQFKEKYGATPDELKQRADESERRIAETEKNAEIERVSLFCESLSKDGLSNAIVDLYKTIRTEITAGEKKVKFAEAGDEISHGAYLDKFMTTVLAAAKDNKLVVPNKETGKVPEAPEKFAELDALKLKWANARPRPDGDASKVKFDEDAFELTCVAYELQELAGGKDKMKYSEALALAPAKLAEIKAG